jgi:hypothetical protein
MDLIRMAAVFEKAAQGDEELEGEARTPLEDETAPDVETAPPSVSVRRPSGMESASDLINQAPRQPKPGGA